MKKQFKSVLGVVLSIALLLSYAPMSVFAMAVQEDILQMEQEVATPTEAPSLTPEESIPTPDTGSSEKPDDTTPSESDNGVSIEPDEVKPSETPTVPAKKNTKVEPELLKVVDKPLVKVVYNYYDAAQNQEISDFFDYTIASTHSYNAIAMANNKSITIAANKYPDKVPVSTDALRFRVLLNGNEDITTLAAYDAATGLVSLPNEYMGHDVTVIWYCPASEITELPVKVTIGVCENGKYTTTTKDLLLPSNANTISVPLKESKMLVVSQNGIDLDESMYSINSGSLKISAPALGGDISVAAHSSAIGIMPMSTDITKVDHIRGDDQIYYGYYTHYYTANGNTAYCLDPTAPSPASGTYNVSSFLKRGQDDLLIKCAYYLYGGPGYNGIKNELFSSPNTMESYGLCHAAASYVYLGDAHDAFLGLDSATIKEVKDIIAIVRSQPMPPVGFDVFLYNVGSQTSQSMMGWDYTPYGDLEIMKVSSNPAMTDGNSCYSLEGAVFDVYDSNNKKIGSITTDKNGKGKLEDIPVGSGFYIVEVKPPKGFAGNSSKISFAITSEKTTTVQVSDVPQNDPVGIILRKQDPDTSSATAQGSATLAGAEFTVMYYKGLYTSASQLSGVTPARKWVLRTGANGTAYLRSQDFVSGDPFYCSGNGDPTLPLGTVTIQETKAPEGYQINNELFIRQITSEGTVESVFTYNEPAVKENVVRGGVEIEKWDYELNRRAAPQGDGSLVCTLEIYNRNDKSVVVGGKTYATDALVYTMTTNAEGWAGTANDLLPYGKYEIIEKTPPTGYLNTGVIRQNFEIKNNHEIVSLKTNTTTIKNNPIRGGVEIEKWDIERNQAKLKQGDATLIAVLEIWNRSASSVLVGGIEYAPNTVVYTMTTNADGWAGTTNSLLPYGSYEIIEKTSPTGYLNTGVIKQSFKIRENGEIVNLKASDKVIKNNIIRGGVMVEKWDNEIDEHRAQGGSTLEIAVLEIINRSADSVLVQDKLYDVGEVVYTFSTDKSGTAITPDDLLPYGTYEVREVKPPEGYLATGILSRTLSIREHKKIVELNTSVSAIKNNPIRGDLKGVKISDGDAKRLANVPFSITSKTTGESHVIVSDANGEINTSSSWNPHSNDTNRGETDRDGIWFGELRTLNDDLGALLYDRYIIEELPCEVNKDRELLKFEVSIYRHMTVVDLGTMTNDYIPTPEIFTTAMDQDTTTGSAYASDTTTIIDTVYYNGLKAGKEYTLKGILYDKTTGKPLLVDGKEITATKTFKALSESGNVTMQFTFDSLTLKGKAVVVFESLEYEGKEVAAHADIDDEGQTVTFAEPKIGTSAAGQNGEKELNISSNVTIVDTVSYENLMPGESYTIKGILMDKSTGKPLLVDGQEVTAETTFKAATATGTSKVTFTFNSVDLIGKSVVVFESLEYKGREIAAHADIEDNGQTVAFKEPKIKTSAASLNDEKELDISFKATIVDTVSYENLTPGETYTLKGILMDKSTGKPLMVDGKEVTAEATFKATSTTGTVKVTFTFNAVNLIGKTVVVFETLEYQGKDIAVHADIEDNGQTVTFKKPKIGTSASGKDGSKKIPLSEEAVVIDKVSYSNLIVGETYTLKGVLMDKATGKPVLVDGKQITAKTEFIPKEPSGTIEVVFTFNSTTLAGKTLVVFESLVYAGEEITTHADINDDAQAVAVESKTPGGGAQTGRDGLPIWMLIIGIVAAAGAVALTIYIRKRKQSEASNTRK